MNGQLAFQTTYSLEDFVAVHFGQSAFNGHVVIGASKKDNASIYRFRSISASALQDEIGYLRFKNMDYYITANSFSGLDRKKENLFALHNIVIDIDHHGQMFSAIEHYNKTEKLIRCIHEQMGIYQPNTVVKTGRGLQLWYAIESAHKSLEQRYMQLTDMLIDQINNIILQDRELYTYFGCVDAAPCRNTAGFFRLPGSYNTNAGCRGTFEIWHEEKINLMKVSCPKIKKFQTEIIPIPKNRDGYVLAKKRLYAMEELRRIRNLNEEPELRDMMNLVIYCSCAAAYDENELRMIVRKFNAGHQHPVTDRELWQQLSTAEKKKYKLSNQWIIDGLHITEEEQIQIGIRKNGSMSGREQERQQARIRKKERNEKIVALALEGYTYKEISQIAGCSEKTVGRVIRSAGTRKSWSDLHAQIKMLSDAGRTKEEMAEVLGVCVRTIERHLSVEGTENVERENTKEENECRKTEQDRCVLQFPDKYTTEYDIENLEEKSDRPDKNAPIYFFTIGTGG